MTTSPELLDYSKPHIYRRVFIEKELQHRAIEVRILICWEDIGYAEEYSSEYNEIYDWGAYAHEPKMYLKLKSGDAILIIGSIEEFQEYFEYYVKNYKHSY